MQSVKEIWSALNAGRTITDGVMTVSYEGSTLTCEPPCPIIPFDANNCEDWEVVVDNQPLYCRWYRDENGAIIIGSIFYPIEDEPIGDWVRLNVSYTREEVLGE